jgi:excisionase family DNA binding protein
MVHEMEDFSSRGDSILMLHIQTEGLPTNMVEKWNNILPLLLRGEELNSKITSNAIGCEAWKLKRIVSRMRKCGLPVPSYSVRDHPDWGNCPHCGEKLSVALIGKSYATHWCPECGWDEDFDSRKPPTTTTYLTVKETAEYLGRSPSTIAGWVEKNILPSRRTRFCRGASGQHQIPLWAIERLK